MNHSTTERDFGFIAIIVLVAITAAWVLLMPWVPAIASASLHRFHLRSSSFAGWAMQFPVPSMYNFANRYHVTNVPPGLIDPILENPLDGGVEQRYINHFPLRVLTFADKRHRYLHRGKDHWFTIQSSYRGQTVTSRLHAKLDPDAGFVLIRLPDEVQ